MSLHKSIRLTALSLILAAGFAGAAAATPITYNINFNVGSATVTGTIQTDGTIGVIAPSLLNPSGILNWNLVLNDSSHTCSGGPCTVTLAGPFGSFLNGGLQTDGLIGQDLIATATTLTFDQSGATPGELFFAGTPGGEFCLATGALCTLSTKSDALIRINPAHKLLTGFDTQTQKLSGALVMGTAVPEPSSLAVLAAGLAMLGLFGFARHRKMAAAALA